MLRAISRSVGAVRCRPRNVFADRRGVSVLEFAIVAPFLLTISIGMLKFGVAMSHYIMLTNAVAQGTTTFALSRGTATPYATTVAAINNAAPRLTAASIAKT